MIQINIKIIKIKIKKIIRKNANIDQCPAFGQTLPKPSRGARLKYNANNENNHKNNI